jgi:VIT1/CCC1 family predicted Fe2+/Mn2+ transporter
MTFSINPLVEGFEFGTGIVVSFGGFVLIVAYFYGGKGLCLFVSFVVYLMV